jgi:hypothetical protein
MVHRLYVLQQGESQETIFPLLAQPEERGF